MNVALDVGASGLRLLRRDGRRLCGRKTPAYYVALPAEGAERRLLQRAFIPYSTCEGSLLVFGQTALDLAHVMRLPAVAVFPEGRLPESDPLGRQVAAMLVESLAPPAGPRAGCVAAVLPGNPLEGAAAADPMLGFVRRLLTMRGYRTWVVHSGLAVVVAELGSSGFTGLGVSVGAVFTSFCFAINGRPLLQCTVPRGAEQLDAAFARTRGCLLFDGQGNQYLDLQSVGRTRSSAALNLVQPHDDDAELFASLCREWLQAACSEFAREIERCGVPRLTQPIPVVCCGGPTRMTGFEELLATALARQNLPLPISEVRLGGSSDYLFARGALICAEIESRTATARTA